MQQSTVANPSPYDHLDLTRDIVREANGVYALRVKGYGFTDVFINDGDIVLIRRVTECENGDMVAVWLKREERTIIKRWFANADHVTLKAEDMSVVPINYALDEVEVQGKVIAVIRQTNRAV